MALQIPARLGYRRDPASAGWSFPFGHGADPGVECAVAEAGAVVGAGDFACGFELSASSLRSLAWRLEGPASYQDPWPNTSACFFPANRSSFRVCVPSALLLYTTASDRDLLSRSTIFPEAMIKTWPFLENVTVASGLCVAHSTT